MIEKQLDVVRYNGALAEKWDAFIETAVNGTFLQSRRFLGYHKDRFEDHSLLFYRKGALSVVCPAVKTADGTFFSHKGSTFGGLIFAEHDYCSARVLETITALKNYAAGNGFTRIVMKITSDLFATQPSALLEYCLLHEGFEETAELSAYVDFTRYKPDIASNFNYNHRRELKLYDKKGAVYRRIGTSDGIAEFHTLLADNLKKHNAVPVHSLGELIELHCKRLPNETDFFGVFDGDTMIAGTMLFYFKKVGVAHTQYLAASQSLDDVSPMSFLYAKTLEFARDNCYGKLSWGIATEDGGRVLNSGLIWFKESTGSLHSLNRTFEFKFA
jgi:hypothetical protein